MGCVNTRPMICYSPYGMASGGHEKPFSRLSLAVYNDDSSSPHRRVLHIPVYFLTGKFKIEFIQTVFMKSVPDA